MESYAINCFDDEEKWEAEEEEEEEEALSLCDLPVKLIKEGNQVQPWNQADGEQPQEIKTEEDFNFCSSGGSRAPEPEMCTADEVFFNGQILPLRRLSVGSDSGLTGCRQDSQNTSRWCLSRSESMDHGSLSRLTSVSSSSRSSSTKSSHYSTSSTNSITARNFNSMESFNSKSNAHFNTHPSPKPQIRLYKSRTASSRNQKSSMWDFFRLGLVRAPELEFQDLKVRSQNNNNANRNSVSRNSSCNSSNSSSSSSKIVNNSGTEFAKNHQDLNKGFLVKRMRLFSGCKSSVDAVEKVPLNNIVVIKSNKNSEKDKVIMSHAAIEEKKELLQELKIKKMKEKQALSRHRTSEWLKELPHASYVVDGA